MKQQHCIKRYVEACEHHVTMKTTGWILRNFILCSEKKEKSNERIWPWCFQIEIHGSTITTKIPIFGLILLG